MENIITDIIYSFDQMSMLHAKYFGLKKYSKCWLKLKLILLMILKHMILNVLNVCKISIL